MSTYMKRRQMIKIASGFLAGVAATNIIDLTAAQAQAQGSERLSSASASTTKQKFIGPFASWKNVQADYKAIGDGVNDDTNALQQALNDLALNNRPNVLYLPAGTYRITQTLVMTSQINVCVVGQDPSNTTIKWDGPQGGTM